MTQTIIVGAPDCSGLLGRTSLRRIEKCPAASGLSLFRPSRPDFIETDSGLESHAPVIDALFRPSRPDFIETPLLELSKGLCFNIVPAF